MSIGRLVEILPMKTGLHILYWDERKRYFYKHDNKELLIV